jgi:hypothetical protein
VEQDRRGEGRGTRGEVTPAQQKLPRRDADAPGCIAAGGFLPALRSVGRIRRYDAAQARRMHADGSIPLQTAVLGAVDLLEFVRGVVLPLAVLLAIVIAGWFGIRWIGKWSRSDGSDRVPFSLEDLRRLRREGAISEEEFERAKEQMLSVAKRPSATKASAAPRGASGDAAQPPREGVESPQRIRPVPPSRLRQERKPPEDSS